MGRKGVWIWAVAALLILVFVDRGNWADVAQWREDQSTNLWLGYTQPPSSMPVGLISSAGIPNPNGMLLLGVVFSRLPDLWAVSMVLGVIQGALILWVCWLIAGPRPLFLLLTLPALISVVLRATSVEFWNQWLMTDINLLFFGLWIRYLRRPTVERAVAMVVPMLLAPAVYLAGIVSAVLYFCLAAVALWIRRPQRGWKSWTLGALAAVIIIGLAAGLTWVPYMHAVSASAHPIMQLKTGEGKIRLSHALEAGLSFPRWSVKGWSHPDETTFKQNSSEILPEAATRMLRISCAMLAWQAAVFLGVMLVGLGAVIVRKVRCRTGEGFFVKGGEHQGWVLVAGTGFVIGAYTISALLGGPTWANGERTDQQVQFLPLMLFAWFLAPFVVQVPPAIRAALRGSTVIVATGFVLASVINGAQIIRAHLEYRGCFLSEADVPLSEKRAVVDWIARDWMRHSQDKRIAVSYDLGGKKWDWVADYGAQLCKWYPAPMTIGRGFDFELRRIYGLRSRQEGVQLRSLQPARYVVSYAFLDVQNTAGVKRNDIVFGRLRVSVVESGD